MLSRHAGEGDSLLVIYELLCRERRPRARDEPGAALGPAHRLLGERLPNRFVDPRGGDIEHEIAAMAAELDEAALVIFPEGGNFTAAPRRGIERLERAGHDDAAGKARRCAT